MSPLLFVLAAKLLQCIVNKAHQLDLLQMPIPSGVEQASQSFNTRMIPSVMRASQRELLSKSNLGVLWAINRLES
jgi:hypothetical protein